jgi:raffinose/stachyose/melibiose transport system permease protein
VVINKTRENLTFIVFLLPACVFYFLFVIVPFLLGLWLSTMNWDGTAPWTPAQMTISEFEEKILNRIESPGDRDLVLKYYVKNADQGTYQKQELYGIDRYRVQFVIAKAGYVNQNFKFIGLDNFLSIFTGKIDKRFFPERYRESKFNEGGRMENIMDLPANEWERNLVRHMKNDPAKVEFLNSMYKKENGHYVLDKDKFKDNETGLQTALSNIPGFEDEWEDFYYRINDVGIKGDKSLIRGITDSIGSIKNGKIKDADLIIIDDAAVQIFAMGYLKGIMNEYWYEERFKMGVLLFTLYFSVLNVVIVNILAIFLALALDTGIKSRNILRSVYFIPNIMSMIIVAFIWQLVFTQLLPKLTGIQSWIMNPDLAPSLTVFVAVWQGLGYYTIIYLAGLQSISTEIMEVSAIDGIPFFVRLFRIILPLIVPAISVCLFLSLAGSLKTFDIIFALYPSNSTSVGVDNLVVNIYYDAFRDKHASLATAKAILLLITIMGITGLQLYLTKKKEVES